MTMCLPRFAGGGLHLRRGKVQSDPSPPVSATKATATYRDPGESLPAAQWTGRKREAFVGFTFFGATKNMVKLAEQADCGYQRGYSGWSRVPCFGYPKFSLQKSFEKFIDGRLC